MRSKIHIHTSIDVEDVAMCCDYETGGKLIKEIDSSMADLDFTLAMAKWFISQLREEFEAVGEAFDIRELIDGN